MKRKRTTCTIILDTKTYKKYQEAAQYSRNEMKWPQGDPEVVFGDLIEALPYHRVKFIVKQRRK